MKFRQLHLSRQIFIALMLLLTMSVLIIGFTSYYLFSNTFSKQVLLSQERTLLQTERTTNSIIRNIEQTVIAESINPRMHDTIENFIDSGYQNIDSVVTRLRDMRNTSRYIFSVYLYLETERKILTSSDGLWDYDRFYDTSWHNQIPEARNSNWLLTRTVTDNTGQTLQILSHVVRLNRQPSNEDDYLIINISIDELVKTIVNYQPIAGELNLLTNNDGMIIASSIADWNGRPLQEILSEETKTDSLGYETVIQSTYNGWYYINYIPFDFVQNQVRNTAMQTSLILAMWLAAGVLIARMLTKRISNPYQAIVSDLQKDHQLDHDENTKPTSEADLLKTVITRIQAQNQTMADKISKSALHEQESIARRLLLDSQSELNQQTIYLEQGNDLLPDDNKMVILAAIDNAGEFFRNTPVQEQYLWRFCLLNILEERLRELGMFIYTQIDQSRYAFIIATTQDEQSVSDKCLQAHEDIRNHLPISVTMAISVSFDELTECSSAFKECLELLKHKMELGSTVISEANVSRGNTGDSIDYMNLLKRDQLFQYLTQANMPEIRALVDKLVKAYVTHPNQISETIYLQISTILSDAISVSIENGWSLQDFIPENRNLYQELMEQETAEMMGEWIKDVLLKLSPSFREKKGTRNSTIIETILSYMGTHYSEDIRLDMMAEKVYLSPSYLSRLFKQETGSNFIETLTSIRIQAAHQLLADPNIRITTIAERCNLGSTNNFIRLFKKYEGMTPGQYRNELAKKKIGYTDNTEIDSAEMEEDTNTDVENTENETN